MPPSTRVLDHLLRSCGSLAIAATLCVAIPGLAFSVAGESPAPSSAPACQAGPDWQTDPMAPGIERVIADGEGHRFDRGRVREVEIGVDGSPLVAQGARVAVVGTTDTIEPRSTDRQAFPRRLSLAPSGELWAAEDSGAPVTLVDGQWQERSAASPAVGASLAVLDDGTVWRVVRGDDGLHRVVWLGESTWQDAAEERPSVLARRGAASYAFAGTPDGRVWLGVDRGPRRGGLAFLEDGVWSTVDDLEAYGVERALNLSVGQDGSLWVLGADLAARPDGALLAHQVDDGWAIFTLPADVPDDGSGAWIGWSPMAGAPLLADDEGRLWASPPGAGLHLLEGETLRRIAAPGLGLGAQDLAADERGCLWAATRRGALYTIDPTLLDPAGSAPASRLAHYHALPPSATGVTR